MRTIIAHAYFGVDEQAVWDAVKLDVQRLRSDVEAVLDRWDTP
jgi:uncharacterized protein with HEPN domain